MSETPWPSEFESIRSNKLLLLHDQLEIALPWDRGPIQADIDDLKSISYEAFKARSALERWTGEDPRRPL